MQPIVSGLLTLALVYRAWSHKSLTPLGIVAAALTALVHAAHPWSNLCMALLFSFYLLGTTATKVKHDVKSKLTISSTGGGGPASRNHIQVLANSIVASALILAHLILTKNEELVLFDFAKRGRWEDALMVGVMAHYAGTTSDTLSSELGILSKSRPRLILPPFRAVPPGTNGGVSLFGLLSGTIGSAIIGAISILLTPFAPENNTMAFKIEVFTVVLLAGVAGTILDSILGALFQASVVDVKMGKVVESDGGGKVLVQPYSSAVQRNVGSAMKRTAAQAGGDAGNQDPKLGDSMQRRVSLPSRKVLTGRDVLSNNGVNLVMAGSMAAAGVAWGLQRAT